MLKNIVKYIVRVFYTFAAATATMITFYTRRILSLQENFEVKFDNPKTLTDFYEQYKQQVSRFYFSLFSDYVLMIALGLISGCLMYCVIVKKQNESLKKV